MSFVLCSRPAPLDAGSNPLVVAAAVMCAWVYGGCTVGVSVHGSCLNLAGFQTRYELALRRRQGRHRSHFQHMGRRARDGDIRGWVDMAAWACSFQKQKATSL